MTNHHCLIGVDIGGTKTSAQIVGLSGADPRTVTFPTAVGSPSSVLRGTINIVDSLLEGSPRAAPDGLGIGVPGQVDPARGTVRLASNLGIGTDAFALGRALSDHFGVPTAIENDVRATALGLHARADLPKPSTLTYLAIGTGVAAGTIIDGHLFRGATGVAGEIGQVIVGERDGMLATVETEAANPDIAERMAQARLERSTYLSAHAPDVMFVLAKAVHTIFMAYDPEVLIIGGGVGTAPGFFHALIRSVETLRHRFDVAREFLDPSRMVVLSPDDPIATESALILAEHARASTKAAISA